MFQSLFFWMTPIKRPGQQGKLDCGFVSILVLLDDSHQVYLTTTVSPVMMKFQSLFFWMTPIKAVLMQVCGF